MLHTHRLCRFIKEDFYSMTTTIRQPVRYHVRGGQRLEGTVIIQGAKNAVLPIIAASLLAKRGQTILHNVPLINDVYVAIEIARALGARIKLHEEEQVMVIDASAITSNILPPVLTNLIRGSVLFLPPVMMRTGQVTLEKVGGCNLGKRSLDFHYRGFARLGAEITEDARTISVRMHKPEGAYLYLDTPSHTGTENLMAAACLAEGTTVIENAALEPEIANVATFLNLMGAKISGVGTGIIQIEGVRELCAVEYTIMPDRIDAGTMAMIAAATQGDVALLGANLRHFGVVRAKLEQMGVQLEEDGPVIRVRRHGPLRPVNVITWPYPGYPTDLQSPLIALACLASGTSYIRETLFDQRFGVADELNKMGAQIKLEDGSAVVTGPSQLVGTTVWAHDLRAGSALIIAGASAEGETIIDNAQMIERGYSSIIRRLKRMGLHIEEERLEATTP
jgi:UDP-N-acetylglucosamine 1-carboxyvinyltransferase